MVLYKEEGNNLLLYPDNIENDVKKKLNIYISYDLINNLNAKIHFNVYDNMTFDKIRSLQRYFLYNIPHCINIEYYKNYIIVELTRKFGLDGIKQNSYFHF